MEFGNWPTRLDTSTNNSLEKYKIQAGEILQIVPGKIKKEILKVFKIWKKSRMNQNCINCFSSWNFCFQTLATVLESQEAYSDSNPRILTLDEFEEEYCHSIAECTKAVQQNKKLLGNTTILRKYSRLA